jgi:plastocyanin
MKRSRTHHRGNLVLVMFLMMGAIATAGRANNTVTAQGAEMAVQIVDFAFEPATLEVPAGTTVVWTNAGSAPHTVTSDTDAFDSGRLDPGGTFSMTFDTPGTYHYHCEFHANMQATIVVVGATGGETTETPVPNATPTAASNENAGGNETPQANEDEPQHLAHIHAGTCDQLGIVVYSLSDVQSTLLPIGDDGAEQVEMIAGTANVALTDLFKEPFSVHIHESEQNKQNYVGCAEIGAQPAAPWMANQGLVLDVVEQAESGHHGIASLRPDTGGATTVTILLIAPTGKAPQNEAGTPPPPPGTTYTSPTFGYTMTYGAAWTVNEESSNNGTDQLVLTNGTSFVTVTGAEAYNGDPDTCVEGVVQQRLADPGVSNIKLATDERGQPIQGGTEATGAFAIYDHDYTFANGTTEPWTLYVQCIPLGPDGAILAFVQNVPSASYADQEAARQALLRGLILPQ